MAKYGKILYWSIEDNSWIAEVMELPGCMADGRTQAEALENLEIIIDEWIETAQSEGMEIPKPLGRKAFAYE